LVFDPLSPSFSGISFNFFASLAQLIPLLAGDNDGHYEQLTLRILTGFINVAI